MRWAVVVIDVRPQMPGLVGHADANERAAGALGRVDEGRRHFGCGSGLPSVGNGSLGGRARDRGPAGLVTVLPRLDDDQWRVDMYVGFAGRGDDAVAAPVGGSEVDAPEPAFEDGELQVGRPKLAWS